MQLRSQQDAMSAHEHVLTIVDTGHKQKYGSMCHKLPILIRQAGLAQALTFLEARGEDAYQKLLEHVANTLGKSGPELAQAARESSLEQYMFLTHRVLTVMVWYKRFAQSLLNVKSGEAEDETGTKEVNDANA